MEKINKKKSILELQHLLIRSGSTMLETLRLIDNNGQGISFVVSEGNKLLGTITDGDIRRSLLNGVDLSASVDKIMNINYYALPPDAPIHEIQRSLSTYLCIPIVDNRGIVIEFASRDHFGIIPISKPDLTGNELSYVKLY